MTSVATPEDFLAHYGVKGMKWGKRKESRSEKKERVSAYKQAKSDYRKAQKTAHQGKIDKARASLDAKEEKTAAARKEYTAVKKAKGRRSVEAFKAKQEWGKAFSDLEQTRETAAQIRDGREFVVAMLTEAR